MTNVSHTTIDSATSSASRRRPPTRVCPPPSRIPDPPPTDAQPLPVVAALPLPAAVPVAAAFKSFLGNDAPSQRSPGVGTPDRGYLPQSQPSGGPFSLSYYQSYFDVNTATVLTRVLGTLNPLAPGHADFLATHLNPPDLYGPFWTLTTLIFTHFLSSSLAASVSAYLSHPDAGVPAAYDFGLLSVAVPLVYGYGIALPALLWVALRYLGVGEWALVEAIAVWGYAMFVWIPVSILAVIPQWIVRWALVGTAFGLSGFFLGRNVYPILASAEAKATRLIIIVLIALHAGLALTFKILFFSYYVLGADPARDAPTPPPPPAEGNGTETGEAVRMVGEMLRRMFVS